MTAVRWLIAGAVVVALLVVAQVTHQEPRPKQLTPTGLVCYQGEPCWTDLGR